MRLPQQSKGNTICKIFKICKWADPERVFRRIFPLMRQTRGDKALLRDSGSVTGWHKHLERVLGCGTETFPLTQRLKWSFKATGNFGTARRPGVMRHLPLQGLRLQLRLRQLR